MLCVNKLVKNNVNDKHLDNELAEYTDRILAGEEMNASAETQEHAYWVRQLSALVRTDEGPSPEFRMKLESVLKDEFKQVAQPSDTSQIQHQKRQAIVQSLRRRRRQQYAGLAALFVAIVGITYIIGSTSDTTGTVSDAPWLLFGSMFVLFVMAWVISNYWERRQK